MSNLLCKLGFHCWYDDEDIINEYGKFLVVRCMRCDSVKVYKFYTLYNSNRSCLLSKKEIPKEMMEKL